MSAPKIGSAGENPAESASKGPAGAPGRRLRILILAYYFPPLNSTASHRPYSWALAWSRAGHEVHVLTTEKYAFDGTLDLECSADGFNIHYVPFLKHAPKAPATGSLAAIATAQKWDRVKLLTRRIRLGMGMFGELAWLAYRPLIKRARELAGQSPFDFVITTSPPEVLHFIGHVFSRRTGTAWIADYRDLWFSEMRINQFRLPSWLTGVLERRWLAKAAVICTVSEGLARRLGQFLRREVIICYNGFMPDTLPGESARPWNDARLHVVYTGRMFPRKRDPGLFFEGLARALRARPQLAERVCVDIYGFKDRWIEDLIRAHGVGELVRMHGHVPHRQSLGAQQHADLLLFLDWMDERAEGILTGKLFECLAAGRPILCVGTRHDSEAATIITRAGAGAVASTSQNVCDRILEALLRAGHESRYHRPETERYSRLRQADLLLERIVASPRDGRGA